MDLRPLGFGEIFDRAVTLYVRNFVAFVAIVMVLVLPLAVLQYVVDLGSQPQFDAMMRVLANPSAARAQPFPTIFDSPQALAATGILLLFSFAIWPFALNAVAVGVASLYNGRRVDFRACYRVVLARWLQILGVIGIEFIVFLGWYAAVVLLAVAVVVVVMVLGAALPVLGPIVGLLAILLVLAVMVPPIAPLVVAFTFGMYAVVIEELGVVAALKLGFARVFNRQEFWRAVLFAVAVCAIGLGASTMFAVLGMVAAIFHLPVLQAVIQSLPMATISPLAVVILAVYYFDVRIRREAFDLQQGLERLTAAQPA